MDLLDFINKNTNNTYKNFKLVSVIFDENTCECVFKFLYKDEMQPKDKYVLANLIREYLGVDIPIVIKCKKSYVDSELVRDVIYNYIVRNHNSLGLNFEKKNIVVEIAEDIRVELICNNFHYEHIKANSIEKEIIDYANLFFFEQFSLQIKLDETISDISNEEIIPTIDIDTNVNDESVFTYHKVDNVQDYIGEVSGNPIKIECVKGSLEGVELCGEIKFITERSFESKRKDKEGNAQQRIYYNFSINDKTGRVNCVYFPNKADLVKFQAIQEGAILLVHGDVEEFGGRLSCRVKSIAYAEILEEIQTVEEVVEEIKSVPDNYIYVKPEPHIQLFQDNLFIENDVVGDYLMNNDVVVFDIETTGLEASRCEIIEIGAVKLHKGKITETFETLIRPSGPIPDEIIDLTGITPEMVVNSPSIKQVMPDFYKFCYGTTIMAYNIDFDYKFINLFGRKYGYIFDNKQIDVLFLARSFVPGLKNFKLSSVCKKLGVSLENAHRAVHDAMATAEVVIKLNTNIT